MIVESEIRHRLIDFLCDNISLQDFEDWLVSHSWNMHRDSSADAQDLVSAIELALSEYSNGHRSYENLRQEIASLLDNIVISINIGVQRIESVRLPKFRANTFQAQVPAVLAVQS